MDNLAQILSDISLVKNNVYPTTLVNGKELPVCPKCGQVTDLNPLSSKDCLSCMEKMLEELGPFNV